MLETLLTLGLRKVKCVPNRFFLAFAFARNVERWTVGELAFVFAPESTGWSADGVWKRREVGLVLLGGKVSERLLPGCAAAFGGGTDLKSGSGDPPSFFFSPPLEQVHLNCVPNMTRL